MASERIQKLIALLHSPTNRRKRMALRELVRYQDDPEVIQAIVHTLGCPGNSGVKREVESVVMDLGERVAPQILELLGHPDWFFRREVVSSRCLVALCGDAGLEALIRLLRHDPHPAVRGEAALALGRTGDRQTVAPLLDALEDSDFSVRSRAAVALGDLGDPQAVPALTARCLTDPNAHVRRTALHALGRIGDPGSIGLFRQVLRDQLAELAARPEVLAQAREKDRLARERRQRLKRRHAHWKLDQRLRRSAGI